MTLPCCLEAVTVSPHTILDRGGRVKHNCFSLIWAQCMWPNDWISYIGEWFSCDTVDVMSEV